jgi:hypothetical protein
VVAVAVAVAVAAEEVEVVGVAEEGVVHLHFFL